MICLDTNVVIGVLSRRPSQLKTRFDTEIVKGELALPVICLFELDYGIAKSTRVERNALRLDRLLQLPITVFPFERADAREAGLIRASLEAVGTQIGPYDILIAAQPGAVRRPSSPPTPASFRACRT